MKLFVTGAAGYIGGTFAMSITKRLSSSWM